jgi:hypothetical protein
MEVLKNRSDRFESKAHGALHGHSTNLAKEHQLSRWSAQRTRHTKSAGEKQTPRNAAIESRSRLLGTST